MHFHLHNKKTIVIMTKIPSFPPVWAWRKQPIQTGQKPYSLYMRENEYFDTMKQILTCIHDLKAIRICETGRKTYLIIYPRTSYSQKEHSINRHKDNTCHSITDLKGSKSYVKPFRSLALLYFCSLRKLGMEIQHKNFRYLQ